MSVRNSNTFADAAATLLKLKEKLTSVFESLLEIPNSVSELGISPWRLALTGLWFWTMGCPRAHRCTSASRLLGTEVLYLLMCSPNLTKYDFEETGPGIGNGLGSAIAKWRMAYGSPLQRIKSLPVQL